jgi:twitching motility two-component system response regulator PilG
MVAVQAQAGPDILVIDDSSTIRRSAEIFLSQSGYSVLLAEDGFEALSKIVERRPALIFCDILMPRLDGYQTCSLIRYSKDYRDTPVVLLSSRDGLFDRARGAIAGATAYLTKPFTKDSLLKIVRDHVSQREAA